MSKYYGSGDMFDVSIWSTPDNVRLNDELLAEYLRTVYNVYDVYVGKYNVHYKIRGDDLECIAGISAVIDLKYGEFEDLQKWLRDNHGVVKMNVIALNNNIESDE